MKIYKIPLNFEQPGHVFNGMIPFRNFIDGLILAAIGYFIASIFSPDDVWDSISWYILCCGLLFILGIMGVQGTPLSVYLLDFIKWSRRRTPYFYNHHGSSYSSSAADVMLEAPQLRDHVAAILDTMTEKLTPKQVNYVEGETFQFAEDPELTFLQNAEKVTEQEIPAEETPITPPPPAPDSNTTLSGLDFDGILDTLSSPESEE